MIGRDPHVEPPDELLANRSDPNARAVLEDWRLSNGEKVTRLGVAVWIVYSDAADDAAADAAAADAAADDAADAADADDADAADAADADAADVADADAALKKLPFLNDMLFGDLDMEDGLKIIQIPGYWSGRSATFVCWLKRIAGDEWVMLPGYRAVYRVGSTRGLSWLAANGIKDDYKLKEESEVAEPVHRLVIRRCVNADVKAWAKDCPKPKDWSK